MQRDLLISTSSFPFNTEIQEAFFIPELAVLSEHFGTIYICPATDQGTISISLPENVKILPIVKKKKRKSESISVLLKKAFWLEFLNGLTKIKVIKIGAFLKQTILFLLNAESVDREIRRIISEEGISTTNLILYSYWLNEATLGMTFVKSMYPDLKVISKAHSSEVYLHGNELGYQPFKKRIIRELNAVICVSDFLRNYIQKNYNIPIDHAIVSRLGTQNYEFIGREELPEVLKIVSIGSADVKRVELINTSLGLIHDIAIEWHHYGSLNFPIGTTTINSKVVSTHFEYLPNNELQAQIKEGEYDVFLNVSSTEGVPVSIMEAMSLSIPCIATAVGGTPEIVDSENGYLLTANPSKNEIADAIRKFNSLSSEERTKKRKAAHSTAFEKYNAEKNFNGLAEAILKL